MESAITVHKVNESLTNLKFYLSASILGSYRGALCLILEHPLDSIKTQWQDKNLITDKYAIVKSIYADKGIIGFYRGFIPNLIRVSSKHLYRWPMMLYFPKFYENLLSKDITKKYNSLHKILAGLTIANLEVFIICPFDRMKVFMMTSNSNASMIGSYIQENKNNLKFSFFKGLEPSFWRYNISWVTFLYFDDKFKKSFKNFKGDTLNIIDLLTISILVGSINLLTCKINFYY